MASGVIQEFEAQYQARLRQGDVLNLPDPPPQVIKPGRKKRGVIRCLLDRLRSQHVWVLAFLHRFDIPFVNSQAQRDIHMVKVQQKISGCFRCPAGADAFCCIHGYLSTMQKQGHTLLSVLEEALAGYPVAPEF